MRESFTIQLKPFSINAMYYGDGRTKTQAARDWSYQVFHKLSQEGIKTKLKKLRDHFDHKKHGYVVRLSATYPEKLFYRKAGGISAKTMDISNWEKPLIDLLFLPKYFDQEPPYGCENLNIDDKYIVGLSSRKQPGEGQQMRISITVVNLFPTPAAPTSTPEATSSTEKAAD